MSLYRNVVWYCKGKGEYTKKGYEAAAKHFNAGDLNVSAAGKNYMITGANSGIGKAAAIDIANKGGTVHMVCRNEERGEQAKNEIMEKTGSSNVHLHLLDMSNTRAVWKFAKDFESAGNSLNVLVNNAGCMVNSRGLTDDGIEKNFATNVLGTYALTIGLMPILNKADKPRVVTVSSGGMLVQQLNIDDIQFEKMKPFDGTMAYAQNKRQQVVMMEELTKKYPKVHFSSMHPGWADTPAVKLSMPSFYESMKGQLKTAEQGADTITWLSLSDAALALKGGEFFQDRKPVPKHLPLAWTKSKAGESEKLIEILDSFLEQFKS
ncbi:dehydrogenase/reductase SDR family member 12-like [Lineus longissimus]|uniref:dehydrogenase/reductase SDR family member 12-like n=1 Tax=Lineus longissimus TaxID=88925 RepID=UPI002B4F9B06